MRSFVLALASAAALALGAGCTVQTRPAVVDGYAVVGANTVPQDIYAYPHVPYAGREAYLVDGRWYYQGDDGWVVFNEEPAPLYHWRTHVYATGGWHGGATAYGNGYGGGYGGGVVHEAPGTVHEAPPAYGGGPPSGAYPPPPPR